MSDAPAPMRLAGSAVVDGRGLAISMTLSVDRPGLALVCDAQGQPLQPQIQAIAPDAALVWFGQLRVPDGLLSAAPVLPRAQRIDARNPWTRELALAVPRENALARVLELGVERVDVRMLLLGVQVVEVPAVAPPHDPRSDTFAIPFVERAAAAWTWLVLLSPATIERVVLPQPLPRGVMSMVDHLLPAKLRRLRPGMA